MIPIIYILAPMSKKFIELPFSKALPGYVQGNNTQNFVLDIKRDGMEKATPTPKGTPIFENLMLK